MPVMVIIIAVWLAFGAGGVWILRRKGHDAFSWMLLFTVLGPLAVPLAISGHHHPPGQRALVAAVNLLGPQLTSLTLAAVVDVEAVVLHGNPAEVLARFASEHGYELVVVGAEERPVWRRALGGSLPRRLAITPSVPVFVGPAAP